MSQTAILGLGSYLPERVVTNAELTARMDTTDAWIQQRTGIRQRHHVDFAAAPMGASDLAVHAARRALAAAGLTPADVELIVYGTLSPDRQFPGDGVLVQAKLDVPAGVPALDIRNQCSAFLYGLSLADAYVRAGTYRRILLIGAEVHSTGLDFSDRGRDVAVLFGDGAAAAVLGPGLPGSEMLAIRIHADGRHADALHCSVPASCEMPRLSAEQLAAGRQYPAMQGRYVFKHAITRMPEAIVEVLTEAGVEAADIDLLVCHQANLRIIEAVQQRLGIDDARVFNNIATVGNVTAASIPLALDQASQAGRLQRGMLVCVAAFGAGFTWGAALFRF